MNPKLKMKAELEEKYRLKYEAKLMVAKAEYEEKLLQAHAEFQKMLRMGLQQSHDAALMAADDTFDVNEYSAEKFHLAHIDYVNKIAHMAVVEDKDDVSMEWTKATVDKRLLQIVGEEHFEDWDTRYGGKDG